jgi:hypothetical protein
VAQSIDNYPEAALWESLRELADRREGRERALLLDAAERLEREHWPWQPIETAPRDPDQQILVYVPPRASARDDDDLPAYQVVAFWDGAFWVAAYDEIDRVDGPTHWMTLKAPPAQ